jgi:hypothetical protein
MAASGETAEASEMAVEHPAAERAILIDDELAARRGVGEQPFQIVFANAFTLQAKRIQLRLSSYLSVPSTTPSLTKSARSAFKQRFTCRFGVTREGVLAPFVTARSPVARTRRSNTQALPCPGLR